MEQEAVLECRLPELLAELGMSYGEYMGRCFDAGLSNDTAKKVYHGKVDIQLATLAAITLALGISDIGRVINIRKNGK